MHGNCFENTADIVAVCIIRFQVCTDFGIDRSLRLVTENNPDTQSSLQNALHYFSDAADSYVKVCCIVSSA